MSDVESRDEHQLDGGEIPESAPVAETPPPAPDGVATDVVTNGKLSLPPVQTTLTDPRLFEIIDWAIQLIASEADLLRTPRWERDIAWLEHARFPGANVRELRLNGEQMTIGEPARIVTAMGALSTNFPAAHRRGGSILIMVVGAIILVPSALVQPAFMIVGLGVIGMAALFMRLQHRLRTTLDVQSRGFSTNGGQARPIEDLVGVKVQKGTDRLVVVTRNPRQEIVIAPRLVADQRDFVRNTLETEITKVRQFHSFQKRRQSRTAPDPDQPKLDLDAITREIVGEPDEEFEEFDGEVVEASAVPEIPGDDEWNSSELGTEETTEVVGTGNPTEGEEVEPEEDGADAEAGPGDDIADDDAVDDDVEESTEDGEESTKEDGADAEAGPVDDVEGEDRPR